MEFVDTCDNSTVVKELMEWWQNQTETAQEQTGQDDLDPKDASWILTTALIIFTMQTGFGLLESGCVSPKAETNIMIKNALDVVFGGVTYWAFGFGFSFGNDPGTNSFIGLGNFFVSVEESSMGYTYALFLFQLSFATTATTIVSGAMAERVKLPAYNIFSMSMTLIYCIPAHWIWAETGFLHRMGVVDIAGCGHVHMIGGTTGMVATLMIGPRLGAFDGEKGSLPSPLKAILGMFMLWWGWLRFNSGSVFIVSASSEWKKAVRAAVNTIVASIGGGITSVVISLVYGRITRTVRYDIGVIVNGVLGSLVSVTAICTLCHPWEAFIIGAIGVVLAFGADHLVYKLKVDDPVGVIPVHLVCGFWGLIAVGLFMPEGESIIEGEAGLFKTGQFYLLGVQTLTAIVIFLWTIILATLFLKCIDLIVGLRLTREEEEAGADKVEHGIDSIFPIMHSDTLSAAADAQNTEEFRESSAQMFKDMLRSCARNELMLVLKDPEPNSITMELRLRHEQRSVNGIEIHM